MDLFGTEYGFCAQTASFWQQVGIVFLIIKIIIPIIFIIVGIITLGKAVISDDEKDAKKGFSLLVKKFLISVLIFFLPTIITALFNLVSGFDELKSDYLVCNRCLTHPKSEYCANMVLSFQNDY